MKLTKDDAICQYWSESKRETYTEWKGDDYFKSQAWLESTPDAVLVWSAAKPDLVLLPKH